MNPSEAAASVLVDELLRCGVVDVVLSPGHRSAPVAVAVATAATQGLCRLHVRIDERTAGFLALGLARGSGRPVAVMCTSGSAVANLAPAVVEADASDVPLVVVTADRPPELRGVGANQTIPQAEMFAAYVRFRSDVEAPAWRRGVGGYWRSTACQAVNAALDAIAPGPVHLNVAFREPLLGAGGRAAGPAPGASGLTDADVQRECDGRPDGRPWTVDGRFVTEAAMPMDSVCEMVGLSAVPRRGLVVVGDVPEGEPYPAEATTLAERLGWPLLSEPNGNARDGRTSLAHGSLLAADEVFTSRHRPDVVVTVGRVGLSRAVNRLVTAAGLHVAVDPRPAARPLDPQRSADVVLSAVPEPVAECAAPEQWAARWAWADAVAAEVVTQALADLESAGEFSGIAVARELWTASEAGGLLFAGASWPVRFLDGFAEHRIDPPWVMGNRGTSGIDGTVATAWGASLAHQRPPSSLDAALAALDPTADPPPRSRPDMAFIGDVTLLHGIGGLLAPADEQPPDLTIVVADNDGGGIFSALEAATRAPAEFERVFGTPHGLDLVAVASSFGVDAVRVGSRSQLREELRARGGFRLVVADVWERSREAGLLQEIRRKLAAALQ